MQICIMFDGTLNYLTERTIGVPRADITHRVCIVATITYSFHNSSKKREAYILIMHVEQ